VAATWSPLLTPTRISIGATLLLELAAVAPKLILHSDRRVKSALGMIFVGDPRTEQRKNAAAGRLHDVAVVAAHRIDHQLQGRIDNRAGLLRIETLINSVEPLMSANKAVTVLRSPSLASAAFWAANTLIPVPVDDWVAIGSERVEAASRPAPHFLQKRAPGLTGTLQAGHSSSSLRPHCSQKAASAGLSLPQ
jgi:hypothetical protein